MKKWYVSKTIWLNIIAIVIYVGTVLIDSKMFGPNGLVFITTATAMLNIIVRFFTDQKLMSLIDTLKSEEPESGMGV